jgi:hypothetical protein
MGDFASRNLDFMMHWQQRSEAQLCSGLPQHHALFAQGSKWGASVRLSIVSVGLFTEVSKM